MKIIISFLFIIQGYIHACTICATDIPFVNVDTQVSYTKKETLFNIKWTFQEEFVSSLLQYDLNDNQIFEENEKKLIKDSLISYLDRQNHLTNIDYRHINKLTKLKFIENIQINFSELSFINDTMIYNYKFILPFTLKNKHLLYLAFNDESDNFNFNINNITLNNYQYSYSLEKKPISVKIILNDSSITKDKEIIAVKLDNDKSKEQSKTYLELLSDKLILLKATLKATLTDIKENNSLTSYIWLLAFSFLYGILHAIGPGHGKSLVSSYFINQEKSYFKAFNVSLLIGVVHTFSAFILTLVVYYSIGVIFNSTIINVEEIATQISAIIIIIIALYLIYKKINRTKNTINFTLAQNQSSILLKNSTHTKTFSCGCNACKTTSTDLGVILAAGIIPCPGTVTIFLFTMSLGIFFVGFISALFMSIGMSLIIFITAIISVKLRKSSSGNKTLIIFLEYVSLFFILFLGLTLLFVS